MLSNSLFIFAYFDYLYDFHKILNTEFKGREKYKYEKYQPFNSKKVGTIPWSIDFYFHIFYNIILVQWLVNYKVHNKLSL